MAVPQGDDTASTTIPSIILDADATEFVGMYLRSLIWRKEGNTQVRKNGSLAGLTPRVSRLFTNRNPSIRQLTADFYVLPKAI